MVHVLAFVMMIGNIQQPKQQKLNNEFLSEDTLFVVNIRSIQLQPLLASGKSEIKQNKNEDDLFCVMSGGELALWNAAIDFNEIQPAPQAYLNAQTHAFWGRAVPR